MKVNITKNGAMIYSFSGDYMYDGSTFYNVAIKFRVEPSLLHLVKKEYPGQCLASCIMLYNQGIPGITKKRILK